MTKQYERIAGTEESMILKEALEKLSEGSLRRLLKRLLGLSGRSKHQLGWKTSKRH